MKYKVKGVLRIPMEYEIEADTPPTAVALRNIGGNLLVQPAAADRLLRPWWDVERASVGGVSVEELVESNGRGTS